MRSPSLAERLERQVHCRLRNVTFGSSEILLEKKVDYILVRSLERVCGAESSRRLILAQVGLGAWSDRHADTTPWLDP